MTISLPPPSRQDRIRIADGRRLAWHEWGPPNGIPVLFCTGAGMSGALGFAAPDRDGPDVRLLAFDRPGLGGSDPHAGKTLSSWADDVGAVIAERGLADPVAVGFSQGAPFALALAAVGHVRAVALVSGQDDLGHPDILPLLPPEVAGMVADARNDPVGFERRIAEGASSEWLWRLIADMSAECDRAIYDRAPFRDRYRACLDEGFAQGAAGYARDLAIALGEWPFAPEAITVPVDLWYGRRDTSPVHSPDYGATLAARLAKVTRHVDDEAGSAILWTRAAAILDALIGHATP